MAKELISVTYPKNQYFHRQYSFTLELPNTEGILG